MVDTYGAIVRGDTTKKQIALVFTGDEFAEGAEIICNALKKQVVQASFFLTGKFYSNPSFSTAIRRIKKEGHYLGAHSDQHLLYCDWTKRDSLLVTHDQFISDLKANYDRMVQFGIKKADAHYFLPPYEWYNSVIAKWTKEKGLQIINFSPGTRSTADYTFPEMGRSYRSSTEIYKSIMDYEAKNPQGLNGFILLIHIGTDPRRTDKFYLHVDKLLEELKTRGYSFLRIDELLN